MATITLRGNEIHTNGELPKIGSDAPLFTLTGIDLSPIVASDYKGKKVILSISPSLDTGVCQATVRKFNEMATRPKFSEAETLEQYRIALENAASIAGMFLTTETVLVEEKSENPAPMMPPGGGMGGMGGMM